MLTEAVTSKKKGAPEVERRGRKNEKKKKKEDWLRGM